MFESETLAASVLANPASVQNLVLTELQNRWNGTYSVADPNSSFNLMLEAASSINAQSVRAMEQNFAMQYAVRATTAADLYNNMSDFDYLSMVASPAPTTINLTFNVDYLIANALVFDATYKRVVIPVGSQFFIGPLTFGIYYPINININRATNNINVLWDTTITNPLYTLSTNMVPFVQYNRGGLNLITLTIPVSQFTVTTSTYPVVSQQGFIQKLNYTDQFYAARVFTNLPTGSWTELAYTLSETVYDPTKPTAKLVIQTDVNTLTVSIPQIYFTNNQIGNQVSVMLYTTKGTLALDLTSVEIGNCNCNFNLNATGVTPYSAILSNLATIDLTPNEISITGGSNAMSFSTLRDLIVNGGLYTSVPITPAELNTYAQKQGFTLTKFIDNVTDRIYYASNTIIGGQNGHILVTMGTIVISTSGTLPSTILRFNDLNAVAILPTTIYTFNPSGNMCTPLSDANVSSLTGMALKDLATELNTNTYTRCPFHIMTYTDSQYPVTKSFNLMNPSVTAIRFVRDNVYLTPQMSVADAVVIHNNNGTGGFKLRLGVTKTSAMAGVTESNLVVYVSALGVNNDEFYGIADAVGTSGILTIYEMAVPTTYYLSQQDTFRSAMISVDKGIVETVDIGLKTTFTVTFLMNKSVYPNVPQDNDIVLGLPSYYNSYLGIAQQKLDIVFGTDLSSQLYNITNAVWSNDTYMTYPETVYLTYPEDVYATNVQGGLIYTTNPFALTKLHSKGDQILDTNNNPIVQYAAGSVKLDANGAPVVTTPRQLNYYVSSMMFDLRLFYSQNATDVAFVNGLTGQMSAYFETLSSLQQNLLEQTKLYYIPNSTMGSATFGVGNNITRNLNLGFSFSFTVYVSQATLDNVTLKAAIVADIVTLTHTEMTGSTISLSNLTETILMQLSDSVYSVDVNGIDGTQSLQTVFVPSGTTAPIVAQKLVYDLNAGTLSLQPDITVNFMLAA